MKATMQSVHANRAGSVWETQRGEDWRERAACVGLDPELWFPNSQGDDDKAKAICARCPVQVKCLESAVEGDQRWGIWGGLDETERGHARCGTGKGIRLHKRLDQPLCKRCAEYKRSRDRVAS